MTKTNDLPYYPRFIFNCSDGNCLSTGDLELFDFIKETGSEFEITAFKPGQSLDITWVDENEDQIIKTYIVNRIQINQIKYDLDEPTFGINSNDCTAIQGKEKKWMMEIYIFLDAKKE
ncbi:hypothetical protein LRR18_13010 [Mangrovimonas sp. AS39]|uniref:hypothetical protein n=1 Tax=Mangrovimonas futianensis TaxID=2895523 RepID=UPI001E577AEF|nr:hypothetical protein [Mangrovimonas futianensis]MCF1192508.1 hypothetical protein [Mangrovimonas futianensis]MCF1196162.1 hypothetical protein [Mangrovimonas futianensis]